VVSLVRAVTATLAGLSLGACSLITSLGGLEATDDSRDGGAGGAEGAALDAAASDVLTLTDSALASDGLAPTDSAACLADVNGDPNNCGACGHDCLGGACSAGACGPVTLAVTHGSVGLAIDSTFAYWADSEAGAINKVSLALTHVGTPTPVVSGAQAQNVQSLATDGTYLYWTNKIASGSVYRALPTGAALTTIASNQSQPDWIASNGTTVVWTNQTGNQVMAAPVTSDGGAAPTQLNLHGENGTVPAGIAIDGANVYYAAKTSGGGLAETAPIAGGSGTVSELGTATYVGIAVDDNSVYWTGGFSNPSVYRNTKAGMPTSETILAAGSLTCPLAITSDGTSVYFLDQGTSTCGPPGNDAGALYRVPVGNAGSLPAALVGGLDDPQGLAVDRTAIYWVTGGPTGAVMKLAK
jgi:sugar lactone lactonase YvrE